VLALSGECRASCRALTTSKPKPDLLFRDVSLYTETIISPEQAPTVIHQAIAAAYAGRGVAHLTLPQDVMLARADGNIASVETLQPRAEIAASAEDVARIASRIDAAGSILIMCGAGCHGAAAELEALSDRLKAPLIHSIKGQDIMPYDDPHWMGGIGMIGSKPVYKAVMSADLLLMVGTDYPYSNFLPNRPVAVQVDERPEVLGRRAPTVLGVLGSARPTLNLLVNQVAPKTGTSYWDRGAPRLGPQARPAGRPRAERRSHPSSGGCPCRQRPRQAGCGIRPRHGPQHALVGQLDSAERIAADHRFLQQWGGGDRARPGQRHPSP
jgi:pyruvate dehydrogenase (quinone)